MKKLISCAALAAAAIALGVSGVNATTATGTLGVSLSVNTSCTVTSSAVNFGSVSNAGPPVRANGSVIVTCSTGTPYKVGLDVGANSSHANSPLTRAMASGGNYLSYDLYYNATQWDNTGAALGTKNGTGSAQTWTVKGTTQAFNSVPASGTYSDTVNITVTY